MIRIYSRELIPNKEQKHYLQNVMRLKPNELFQIFNESGAYEMKAHSWELGAQIRQAQSLPIKALAFALIKPNRLSMLIEKAIEVGATHLFPLTTQRTQMHSFKKDRIEKIIIEATEQCGRLSPAICYEPQTLEQFLTSPPLDVSWFFGDFEGGDKRIGPPNYGFIVGPEGGFSPSEIETLRAVATGIRLSPHVLRAETAAIVGMCFFSPVA